MEYKCKLSTRAANTLSKQAFRSTGLNQIARLALGPLILMLLPFFLTNEQQGFWFAMTSIVAILAFADMGLSAAVMQCAAHEYAILHQGYKLDAGDAPRNRERLNALLTFSIRRVSFITSLALPCVLVIGLFTFNFQGDSTDWVMPWIIFCVTAALSLILSVILSFLEGCDAVVQIQRLRALVAMVNLLVMALGLVLGWGLWTLPLASGSSTAIGFKLVWKMCPKGFLTKHAFFSSHVKTWAPEVSPLLTKYAASWIGGYIMFQLFTPIVFRIEGATAAGRVGLTISLFTAIFTLSNIWSAYQLPKFAMAIAIRDQHALNDCFSKAMKGSFITFVLLTLTAITIFLALRSYPTVEERLLNIEAIAILGLAWLLQIFVHNMAVYLRAFKEEPIVWHTLLAASHTIIATMICLHYFSLNYLFLGFLTVYVWFTPAVYVVFNRKRKTTLEWTSCRG